MSKGYYKNLINNLLKSKYYIDTIPTNIEEIEYLQKNDIIACDIIDTLSEKYCHKVESLHEDKLTGLVWIIFK